MLMLNHNKEEEERKLGEGEMQIIGSSDVVNWKVKPYFVKMSACTPSQRKFSTSESVTFSCSQVLSTIHWTKKTTSRFLRSFFPEPNHSRISAQACVIQRAQAVCVWVCVCKRSPPVLNSCSFQNEWQLFILFIFWFSCLYPEVPPLVLRVRLARAQLVQPPSHPGWFSNTHTQSSSCCCSLRQCTT